MSEFIDRKQPQAEDEKSSDTIAPLVAPGVVKVAAASRVWGKTSLAILYLGVAFVAYATSLDSTTTYLYLALATSSFEQHSLLSAIAVAQAIILAVAKPPSAKLADVFGRAEAYLMAITLYAVGYIRITVVASCTTVNSYAGGIIIYAAGSAAIQILQQIVIADVSSMRWRGFVSQLVNIPFFINAFVAPNVGAYFVAGPGWRWGYAMFTILVPCSAALIIGVLFWAQHKARKLGVGATTYSSHGEEVAAAASDGRHFFVRSWSLIADMDLLGLLFFAAGWSMMLVPITLVNGETLTWNSGKIIGLIVAGCVLLVIFVAYEGLWASLPIVPFRFFKNRTVVFACSIAFVDFVSFYLQYTYQYSFMYVEHLSWGYVNLGYFADTQTLSLTFFAILGGLVQYYTRRLKWLLVVGLAIRLLGVGVMLQTKGVHGTTAGLVLTQIVQGMGGGIAAVATQTAVQGVVAHQDVAGVTAVYLLFAEIGGSVGTAIAGAIWKGHMPQALTKELSGFLNSTEITAIFDSITTASSYDPNSPIFIGVVTAYNSVMKILLIAATTLAVIPFICAFFIEDIHLGDEQNCAERIDVVEQIEQGKAQVV